ncbi:MAG: hypothetical protein WBC78_08975 [Candidatus Sulfotelmatobacter sp.]
MPIITITARLEPTKLLATLPEARDRVYVARYGKKLIRQSAASKLPSREVRPPRKIRLLLDSNVLTSGIVSQWGLDAVTVRCEVLGFVIPAKRVLLRD